MTKKKLSFEDALKRLEEIVSQLESGEISLDESLKAFEEGRELVGFCLNKLDEAEQKVKKLEVGKDGKVKLSDL